jgi:NADH-quinone oxidoreductase subunit C
MKITPNELEKEVEKRREKRLVTIICIDEGNFRLIYQFDDKGKTETLELSVLKKKPVVKSITEFFPNSDFYEREIHDFFGVEFKGNPRLHEKLFLPDDWKGKPPLRKD